MLDQDKSISTPKLIVDESVGRKLFLALADKGFNVLYVGDSMPGAPDLSILAYAEQEKRILITNDKDFGELIFRLKRPSSGVIFLRLRDDRPPQRLKYVLEIIGQFSHQLSSHFLVVTEDRVRIRRL